MLISCRASSIALAPTEVSASCLFTVLVAVDLPTSARPALVAEVLAEAVMESSALSKISFLAVTVPSILAVVLWVPT